MIEGPGRASEDFALAVAKAAPGASVSDQTDAWVAVDITATSGVAGIEALLPRLVNLDPRRLAPDRPHARALSIYRFSSSVARRII
ncbi:hypothetical protein ACFSHQ_07200 [Gemmobacter lanyuensis]